MKPGEIQGYATECLSCGNWKMQIPDGTRVKACHRCGNREWEVLPKEENPCMGFVENIGCFVEKHPSEIEEYLLKMERRVSKP